MTTFATGTGGVVCNVGGLETNGSDWGHKKYVPSPTPAGATAQTQEEHLSAAKYHRSVGGEKHNGIASLHERAASLIQKFGEHHRQSNYASTAARRASRDAGPSTNSANSDKSKQEQQDVASPQGVPSVEVARKNTEQAKAQEKAAIEKEKQQQMFTTAMDKGRDADAQTKKALGLKPQSGHGRKAHAAAAVAHKDAHKHFSGVSGEKGGLNHDQRAAAERKAAKHKKLAEVHQSMSEVMGGTGTVPGNTGGKGGDGKPTKNSTGCPGVGVEINGLGGEFRSAAEGAKANIKAKSEHAASMTAKAFRTGKSSDHAAASRAHKEAAEVHPTLSRQDHHYRQADIHGNEAAAAKRKGM